MITNNTSSKGITGHAAIANSDNYILDMPGTGRRPAKSNNRQSTVSSWLKEYDNSGKYVKVYRLKDQDMAKRVARYADRNYYSTTGSATKNIQLDYGIDYHLYQKSPSYCSKLVYQAYYFGSGAAKVVYPKNGFVAPYFLIGTFTANYKPQLKKTF
ncbi:YiiX/YebB-like N1pC/P60 family cysteine hydrolase [Listeria sp. PSOL-1]|uniref:YiiX/YebB-like N1pC/P60 family cysteine hydrolase n=1 Tax=Listeria sp. PSOL-1 TaxID=1844999 RepID=UPI0013CF6E59|nr:YiiX/YebB-like N1pC/P60 family cysteine hydrolase [Listeria sp. PSOL-1]